MVTDDADGGVIKVTKTNTNTTPDGTVIPRCTKFIIVREYRILSELTGVETLNQGDLLYADATDTLTTLSKDSNVSRYLANTGTNNNPKWDQVNLENGVSGILPAANGGVPVGAMVSTWATVAPSGWLLMQGGTIGNVSSGGTARANADTFDLFEFLWNNLANAEAPVSSGRGLSALADFNANKTITIPSRRGVIGIGVTSGGSYDTMGDTYQVFSSGSANPSVITENWIIRYL